VRAELKGLPKDLAETVGAHIWAAGQLVDLDPELAFRHAEAARRRAGRLPIVREAAAETAYAAGEYAVALREFRAIRRMSGGDELIPVIADCERALGRPRDALQVLSELNPKTRDIWLRIECLLVEAGTRADMGQKPEAMRLLQAAISRKVGPPFGQARLRYAYANLLEEEGDVEGAREWFSSAAALDQGTELDTADRIARLDGVVLPDFELEDDDDTDDHDDTDDQDDHDDEDDEALDADASDEDLADHEDDVDDEDVAREDASGALDLDEVPGGDLDLDDSPEGDLAVDDEGSEGFEGSAPEGDLVDEASPGFGDTAPEGDAEDGDSVPEGDAEDEDVTETDEQDDDQPAPAGVTDDDAERAADDGDAVDDNADLEEEKH
jgi:tetratricopeptide (TPR) repeat protein